MDSIKSFGRCIPLMIDNLNSDCVAPSISFYAGIASSDPYSDDSSSCDMSITLSLLYANSDKSYEEFMLEI